MTSGRLLAEVLSNFLLQHTRQPGETLATISCRQHDHLRARGRRERADWSAGLAICIISLLLLVGLGRCSKRPSRGGLASREGKPRTYKQFRLLSIYNIFVSRVDRCLFLRGTHIGVVFPLTAGEPVAQRLIFHESLST